MRIVHVEAGRHWYGGAVQVHRLIEGLSARSVDNVLLCPPGSAIAAARPAADVVELPMAGDLDLGFCRRLARVITARRPDLVHVHSRRGADLHGGRAAARTGVPAVLTRRVDNAEPVLLARAKCRPYRAVIAISRCIETQLLERIRLPRGRVFHVPSAVDSRAGVGRDEARRRLLDALGLPAHCVLAGVVAQLIPRKGHDWLLDCMPALRARVPGLVVLCFGRGPLAPGLAARIEAEGLGADFRLLGFRDDLAELLPGLDLLVHPAWREGLGVAVLEALAAGVPVVASACGGIVDVVRDDVDGLLVAAGDRPALTAAIERLCAEPGLRARLGAAGRASVAERFSTEAMIGAHLNVYRHVLAGRVAEAGP